MSEAEAFPADGVPLLRIAGLAKIFEAGNGRTAALNGIELTVAKGEFVCLLGASGCGKSTLLRIIAGFETATAGTVAVRELSERMVKLVAAVVPKLTAVAPVKPLPVIVTVWPPAASPLVAVTPVTAGLDAAVTMKWSLLDVPEVPPGVFA